MQRMQRMQCTNRSVSRGRRRQPRPRLPLPVCQAPPLAARAPRTAAAAAVYRLQQAVVGLRAVPDGTFVQDIKVGFHELRTITLVATSVMVLDLGL